MQTIDSKVSNIAVVAFNPAISQRKEKLAVQLIRELADINKMPNDIEKVLRHRQWKERALELADELPPH